jgi:hypothetical protein
MSRELSQGSRPKARTLASVILCQSVRSNSILAAERFKKEKGSSLSQFLGTYPKWLTDHFSFAAAAKSPFPSKCALITGSCFHVKVEFYQLLHSCTCVLCVGFLAGRAWSLRRCSAPSSRHSHVRGERSLILASAAPWRAFRVRDSLSRPICEDGGTEGRD